MTDKIALTSSMRSNLLSLKNTQKLFDSTQEKLSTGYKVNSAMDNPSSYFTAQALNARADDLSTLLDSIGQAISTLETADKGITSLQKFVSQAKSIANSARDTANVASSVTSTGVTFNATTAKTDKLSDYLNNIQAGDEFTIRLGNSTKMEAFANVAKDQKLSEAGIKENMKMEMIVGDKTYEFTFTATGTTTGEATTDALTGVVEQNISVDDDLEKFMNDIVYTVGRKTLSAEIKDGKLSFSTLDNSSLTIRSTAEVATGAAATGKAIENITAAVWSNGDGSGATAITGATINVGTGDKAVKVDISDLLTATTGVLTDTSGAALADRLNASFKGTNYAAKVDSGALQIYDKKTGAAVDVSITAGTANGSGGTLSADAAVAGADVQVANGVVTDFNDTLGFDKGSSVVITKDMTVEQFRQAINNLEGISADFNSAGKLVISGEQGDDMVIADVTGGNNNVVKALLGKDIVSATNGSNERATYATQFNNIMNQIDELVQDTSYKGINLLKGDDLTVVFNESRTSQLELKGVKFDSIGLGFTTAENEWIKNDNIDKSLDQINKATSLLRAQASEFGQNLSTVQIREDFTEQMINNLTSGADKLTLADANEEAANLLALQTRQALATNSLSLASQSSQSVLKLF